MKTSQKALIGGLFLMLAGLSYPASAETLLVPQEYPTIQAALTAASDGDEVVVSPGIYEEDLEMSKPIVLRSTFDGKDWSIVENTIIRPPRSENNHPVVLALGGGGTIRGLTLTRNPIEVPPPSPGVRAIGIMGDANVEYCIIENQVNSPRQSDPWAGAGGAIHASAGTIQNNIIRNNHANSSSALYACSGLIRNNIIYNNSGGFPLGSCSGKIVNNTIYNNNGGFARCEGIIQNNIVWWEGEVFNPGIGGSSTPGFCIIKDYDGPGEGNINANPKFLDPANGDFRLHPDSPAIDAGKAVPEVKADFANVQRGLRVLDTPAGDGSRVDIGAHEFIPRPVAVWFPGGGPDEISPGDELAVAWQTEIEPAGTAVALDLLHGEEVVAELGAFFNEAGMDTVIVTLPADLVYANDYTIRATSTWDRSLSGQTPAITILGPQNAVQAGYWTLYR